jgi:hypothetical protein
VQRGFTWLWGEPKRKKAAFPQRPDAAVHSLLAITGCGLSRTRHIEEARAAVAAMLHETPGLTVCDLLERIFFRDLVTLEYHRRGFVVGGMPEGDTPVVLASP